MVEIHEKLTYLAAHEVAKTVTKAELAKLPHDVHWLVRRFASYEQQTEVFGDVKLWLNNNDELLLDDELPIIEFTGVGYCRYCSEEIYDIVESVSEWPELATMLGQIDEIVHGEVRIRHMDSDEIWFIIDCCDDDALLYNQFDVNGKLAIRQYYDDNDRDARKEYYSYVGDVVMVSRYDDRDDLSCQKIYSAVTGWQISQYESIDDGDISTSTWDINGNFMSKVDCSRDYGCEVHIVSHNGIVYDSLRGSTTCHMTPRADRRLDLVA